MSCRICLAFALALAACHEDPPPPGSPSTLGVQIEGPHKLERSDPNPALEAPERSPGGAYEFAPTTAETPAGTWRAFDRAGVDGIFDIVVTPPGPPARTVAERPTHQAAASLAAGPAGRVWLAFEEGLEDWGRGGPLARHRRVVLGELDPSGAFSELDGPAWAEDAEAPELTVDGLGRPWLFVRKKKSWAPVGADGKGTEASAANRRVAWSIQAGVLGREGWSAPVTLPLSDGPEDGALELVPTATGARARYFSDGRLARIIKPALTGAWDKPLPGEPAWYEASLSLAPTEPPGTSPPSAEASPADTDARKGAAPPAPLSTLPSGMRLLWGDLHRHTDASRCKIDEDGDLEDAYRYALGTAGLDFLAVTDHFQHMTPAVFTRELESANAYDQLDDFVAFGGFERALPRGHWTMIAAASGAEVLLPGVFAAYRPRFLWDDFAPKTWMAIPHQITDRAAPLTWDETGTDLDPVIELYQSRRGSYESRDGWLRDLGGDPEAPWAVDYLSDGRHFGVTASSDHATTDGAFTAVLIPANEEPSRAAILAALRARRCYAATAPIGLDFWIEPGLASPTAEQTDPTVFMGGEVEADALGPDAMIRVAVDARRLSMPRVRSVEVLHGHAGAAHHTEEVIASFPKKVAGQGLLTLRIGRANKTRRVTLLGEGGVSFGEPTALGLEPEDQLARIDGALALSARLDPRDVDGLTTRVDFPVDSRLVVKVQSGERTATKSLALADLEEHPSEVFWSLGARTSVRLDRLSMAMQTGHVALPAPTLEPGDWLYVRLVTESGDAAWSSPIFVR